MNPELFQETLESLIPYIEDDYRASEFETEDDEPGMQVTFACDNTREWTFQTGDNSYMGAAYHYPHWAVVYLYRDSDCKALAEDAIAELEDLIAEDADA